MQGATLAVWRRPAVLNRTLTKEWRQVVHKKQAFSAVFCFSLNVKMLSSCDKTVAVAFQSIRLSVTPQVNLCHTSCLCIRKGSWIVIESIENENWLKAVSVETWQDARGRFSELKSEQCSCRGYDGSERLTILKNMRSEFASQAGGFFRGIQMLSESKVRLSKVLSVVSCCAHTASFPQPMSGKQ